MEVFLGNREQKLQTTAYLDGLRTYLPKDEFSPKTTNTRFSKWLEQPIAQDLLNISVFNEIINGIEKHIQRFDPNFRNLPFDRYVIGEVPITNDDTGGFNSKYSRGFKYLSKWGYSALLNRKYTTNPNIATLELARSYLHDSMHSASFRTIRWLPKGVEGKFPAYREQYGFNFRKADGTSYSINPSPEQAPEAINLNLLMDGIVIITTGREIRPYAEQYRNSGINDFEKTILDDIENNMTALPESYKGKKFHEQVTVPSEKFIKHWGGEPLYELLMKGMLTGRFRELVPYFNNKLGTKQAWQKLFKSERFK